MKNTATTVSKSSCTHGINGQAFFKRLDPEKVSIVKAWKADTTGNLIFRRTARNFNPMMAQAGKVTIAEVEEIVPAGTLDPDQIHTPGIFVQRVVCGAEYEKRIEQRTVREA